MYNRLAISSLLILLSGVFLGQAALAKRVQSSGPERFVGTWAGTWEGAGSTGKIEMTLAKDEAGKLSGQVTSTTDNGDYTAKFRSLSFDASKMTAKYDFPLADQTEVVLTATFDERMLKGTWSLRIKGQEGEQVGGPWTAVKK